MTKAENITTDLGTADASVAPESAAGHTADPLIGAAGLSWQDTGAPACAHMEGQARGDSLSLATQIMNVMEQAIIVWSSGGVCQLHNTRVFDVLELDKAALSIGTEFTDFVARAAHRGEFSDAVHADILRRFELNLGFKFERSLPSGRIVASSGRPTREGGCVVTSTDVSAARRAAADLAEAKRAAEEATAHARTVLEEERARRAEARTLADLDEWLQSCKSLDELFRIVVKFLGRLLPGSAGELYVYSNSRDVLDGVCEWGQSGAIADHIAPDACWSLRRGRTYEYNPEAICFHCDHIGPDPLPDQDYICVPVVAHGDTVGLLHLRFPVGMSRRDVKSFGRFTMRCAEHISMAIANVKLRDELHDQSIRDPLTGLYNRRYFMDALRSETAKAGRTGKGFGLISFDADNFKTFNDNHGHDAGDMVLRALAEKLRSDLQQGAVCARVGGEEFAILLAGHDMQNTLASAEALRISVSEMSVSTAYGVLPRVTISAGVAANRGDTLPPSVLMKRADEALYAAKAAGRNCVKTSVGAGP